MLILLFITQYQLIINKFTLKNDFFIIIAVIK